MADGLILLVFLGILVAVFTVRVRRRMGIGVELQDVVNDHYLGRHPRPGSVGREHALIFAAQLSRPRRPSPARPRHPLRTRGRHS